MTDHLITRTHKLTDWSLATANRLGSLSFCVVAQQGILYAFPLILIGIAALAIPLLPFAFIQTALNALLGSNWQEYLKILTDATFGIASLAILCGMAFGFAHRNNDKNNGNYISPAATIIVALACFFSFVAHSHIETWREILSLPKGFIISVLSATASSYTFIWFSQKPAFRLRHTTVNGSLYTFEALRLLPASLVTIAAINLAIYVTQSLLPANPGEIIDANLIALAEMLDSDLLLSLIYSTTSQILWLFGIHGPSFLNVLDDLALNPPFHENIALVQSGLPATHIISKTFMNIFSMYGGSGSTLCLIIAILWKGSDTNLKKLVFISLFPALMNVNEPVLFGVPILLNPIYAIPFILTPIVQILVSYITMAFGWVPLVAMDIHWTCPPLLSGYLGTGGYMSGAALQAFNIIIGVAVYLPFVLLSERVNAERRDVALASLTTTVCNEGVAPQKQLQCVHLQNTQGTIARHLAHDLALAIGNKFQLTVVYQPQFDTNRNTFTGMEALLRWKHPVYGMVPPPVIIALAEDIELIDQLGLAIIRNVLKDINTRQHDLPEDFITSVNLSPIQLQNTDLATNIMKLLDDYGIPPHKLELEITETAAISPNVNILDNLHRLRRHGINIAIDDFGMGHASLRYLRELPINTIKIDRSLTDETNGLINIQVINSILTLCQSLHHKVIIEGIEDEINLERLRSIGCSVFQGYYFSLPLPLDQAIDCISAQSKVINDTDLCHAELQLPAD